MHNITIHTWAVVFLRHLANTSFMASFQAQTEPHSGLTLRACILVPCPAGILCLLQRIKFHTQHLLLFGWLLTDVQVNIITTLHDTRHTCIYVTLVLLSISSFYTSSIFLGRLAALHSLHPLQLLHVFFITVGTVPDRICQRIFPKSCQKLILGVL
jgi:hypothetical protein